MAYQLLTPNCTRAATGERQRAVSLQAAGSKLMLEGLNERVLEQLEDTEILDLLGRENVFLAKSRFGDALKEALAAAERWIAEEH